MILWPKVGYINYLHNQYVKILFENTYVLIDFMAMYQYIA